MTQAQRRRGTTPAEAESIREPMTPRGRRYRWVVLAAGVFAQASAASVLQGIPSLSPILRSQFSLTLTSLGLVLAASTVGLLLFLVPWGFLADRIGERWVMTVGLLLGAAALVGAALSTSVPALAVSMVSAGAACASVNAASGRAVILWFPRSERGLAMGARQTAIPLGAAVASIARPAAARAWGLGGALLAAAAGCGVGALVVWLFVRDPGTAGDEDGPPPIDAARGGDRKAVLQLCVVSLLLVVPQLTVVGFLVVYLVDGHAMSAAAAAGMLAIVQLGGGAARIGLGAWSDRRGARIAPLQYVATVTGVLFALAVVGELIGGVIAVAVLVLAGFASISWNGLAFTAIGELAEPKRIGLTLGVQNTAVAAGMAITPPLMGIVVESSSWPFAFGAVACVAAIAAVILRSLAASGREPEVTNMTHAGKTSFRRPTAN